MIVSGLPIWIVVLFAMFITAVYYLRYRKTTNWMNNKLVLLFIFAIHFFFFAYGVVIFLATEIIRAKVKKEA